MTEIKKPAATPAPARESLADAIAAAIAAAQTVAIPAMREALASPLSEGDVAALKAMNWHKRPIGSPAGQRGLMAPRGRGADSRQPQWPDFSEISGSVAGLRQLFASAVVAEIAKSANARKDTGKQGGMVWIPDLARLAYSMEIDFQTVETMQRFLVAATNGKILREKGYLIMPETPSGNFPQFSVIYDKGVEEFNHNLAEGSIIFPEDEHETPKGESAVTRSYF